MFLKFLHETIVLRHFYVYSIFAHQFKNFQKRFFENIEAFKILGILLHLGKYIGKLIFFLFSKLKTPL